MGPRPQRTRLLLRALRARLRSQRAELRALCGALRRGDVAVDVGANKGSHTLWMARAVGSRGRVLACEPQLALAEGLARDLRSLGLYQCEVRAVALGAEDGRATLHIPTDLDHPPGATLAGAALAGSTARAVEVPVQRLDTLLRGEERRIAAVKIDVEGYESAVLRGAAETIAGHRPLLVVEIEARHLGPEGVDGVLTQLEHLGYGGHFVRQGALVPIREFRTERDQAAAGPRFWERPEYCNNFVLTPR